MNNEWVSLENVQGHEDKSPIDRLRKMDGQLPKMILERADKDENPGRFVDNMYSVIFAINPAVTWDMLHYINDDVVIRKILAEIDLIMGMMDRKQVDERKGKIASLLKYIEDKAAE